MFTLIAGKEGCGKTKTLIDLANSKVKQSNGNVIFIDDDTRHMYDLHHDMRFISMNETPLKTSDEFFGFIVGLMSNNYDIETIYIDGLTKIIGNDVTQLAEFAKRAETFTKTNNVEIFSTVNMEIETIPDTLQGYLIK